AVLDDEEGVLRVQLSVPRVRGETRTRAHRVTEFVEQDPCPHILLTAEVLWRPRNAGHSARGEVGTGSVDNDIVWCPGRLVTRTGGRGQHREVVRHVLQLLLR